MGFRNIIREIIGGILLSRKIRFKIKLITRVFSELVNKKNKDFICGIYLVAIFL